MVFMRDENVSLNFEKGESRANLIFVMATPLSCDISFERYTDQKYNEKVSTTSLAKMAAYQISSVVKLSQTAILDRGRTHL